MTVRFSVTELALAARCPRQMLFAREGLRIVEGDGGIGQTAHAVLAAFVQQGAAVLAAALAREPLDEDGLLRATAEALYSELYAQAPAVAPKISAQELVRLARVVFDLGALAGELLVRARKTGLRGEAAFARTFEASERRVELELGGAEVGGVLDLHCRDIQSGEAYVFDLKTGVADSMAEEQVRLYALALSRAGEKSRPALALVSGNGLELRRVDPLEAAGERALEDRVRALAEIAEGRATPPPAPDLETCRTCPVQKPCWSRWGRTLHDPSSTPTPPSPQSELEQEAIRLHKALAAHRVKLDRVDPARAIVGPNAIRFRLELRDGESIRKVERSARDLQRAMDWPVPPLITNDGRFVSIDAPRREREVLSWQALPMGELRGLELPVGLTLDRQLAKIDLEVDPHVLVAGTTGSGKSVLLQGFVLSLLERMPRDQCQVVIVDPKMLDFTQFNPLPLWRPVITDPTEAVQLLQSLVNKELPARTEKLRKAGVQKRCELPPGTMPALVVVIDEFADLYVSLADRETKAQFLQSLQRLLQRARAVGIHLVIATQRPSVDAVPGLLKANLPVRIALKLPSVHDSGTVLDEGGAENLLGRGDLLLKREGRVTRAQAYNVTLDDVSAAARH